MCLWLLISGIRRHVVWQFFNISEDLVAVIFVCPEDGHRMSPWNLRWPSPEYTALYPRKQNILYRSVRISNPTYHKEFKLRFTRTRNCPKTDHGLIKDDFTVRIHQWAQSLKTMATMMMMVVRFNFDPLSQMTETFRVIKAIYHRESIPVRKSKHNFNYPRGKESASKYPTTKERLWTDRVVIPLKKSCFQMYQLLYIKNSVLFTQRN
jgi:hypothetical protein